MNCREFLIEFEERGTLSKPAILHLTVCADCQTMSERQAQIWRAIDNFVKINVPNDFDFRVKARIANARPADFQPRFLPVLRYVLPIVVVFTLVGLIAFNSSYFSSGNVGDSVAAKEPKVIENTIPTFENQSPTSFAPPQTVAEKNPQTAPETIQPPVNNRIPRDQTAEASPKQRPVFSKNNKEDEGAGSYLSGVGSKKPFVPKGFEIDSNSNVETSKSPETTMLEFSGIKTAFESGRRIVKSVEPNSTAARSGIKVGDIIERVNGDSIFVSRGAERIEIKLQRNISQP